MSEIYTGIDLGTNSIKVVVVDNNSEDRDELDKTEFSTNLYLDSNIGYFPALNKGLKNIDLDLFEYVIICNNDLIFTFIMNITNVNTTNIQISIHII